MPYEAIMATYIVHVVFDPATDTYKLGNHNGLEELEATPIPFSLCLDSRQARDISTACPTKLRIYLDSGATICLGGPKHLQHMGLSERNFDPSKKGECSVVGGSPWCVMVGCLSNSWLEKGPQSKYCTYARKYKWSTSARQPVSIAILPYN